MNPTVEMIDAGWKAGLGLNKLQVERIVVAALAAMPAHGVKVKPLEWVEYWGGSNDDLPSWRGKNPLGLHVPVDFIGKYKLDRHSDAPRDELEAAKASAQADYERRIMAALEPAPSLAAENERLAAEVEELKRGESTDWQPISTCPLKEAVDLWCVYGCEEYARYDGGASIGQLVVNRFKHEQYGFFGNQYDGVPRGHAKDLVPVAWRPAVKQCPAELIAEVLGIPLTLEDAKAALEDRT